MLKITDRAQDELKRIMREECTDDSTGIRLGIKGGGCSGFNYVMQFEKEKRDFDTVFNEEHTPIFIDAKSLMYLENMEIDFESDILNSGFKFINPNASKTCGCGTSFSV
ncbi:MAG: iron-sulfur cluster assembly accessory protein [Acidobacteria bacterium]|nr:MAG: iron-sulfur cluster assembly accessory protein [Acidobacteriota bacterium]